MFVQCVCVCSTGLQRLTLIRLGNGRIMPTSATDQKYWPDTRDYLSSTKYYGLPTRLKLAESTKLGFGRSVEYGIWGMLVGMTRQ